MVEVQAHGLLFEKWVQDTFFDGYEGIKGQEWDVPAEFNNGSGIPEDFRGLPVSIKTAKYGSPIGLGDAPRQRRIQEPFLMIVGFWRQRSSSEKWYEDIGYVKFLPEEWGSLWGSLSLTQIEALDGIVKNHSLHYSEARKIAKQWKRETQISSGSRIVINPKIASNNERRTQCSLPFRSFWEQAGRSETIVDFPELFRVRFQNPISSRPRIFNRDQGQAQDER